MHLCSEPALEMQKRLALPKKLIRLRVARVRWKTFRLLSAQIPSKSTEIMDAGTIHRPFVPFLSFGAEKGKSYGGIPWTLISYTLFLTLSAGLAWG